MMHDAIPVIFLKVIPRVNPLLATEILESQDFTVVNTRCSFRAVTKMMPFWFSLIPAFTITIAFKFLFGKIKLIPVLATTTCTF